MTVHLCQECRLYDLGAQANALASWIVHKAEPVLFAGGGGRCHGQGIGDGKLGEGADIAGGRESCQGRLPSVARLRAALAARIAAAAYS